MLILSCQLIIAGYVRVAAAGLKKDISGSHPEVVHLLITTSSDLLLSDPLLSQHIAFACKGCVAAIAKTTCLSEPADK